MKTKTVNIALEGLGSYLGMENGCFIVKDKQGNTEKYPLARAMSTAPLNSKR